MADDRSRWMGLLARAAGEDLATRWQRTGLAPGFEWLRAPEHGTVMVRGRAGGTGAPFNLGEMTATRCALRLESGTVGHAYVPGRDRRKAEIAALCDALLQEEASAQAIRDGILAPLEAAEDTARRETAARAAATKVDFFTMARGDE